MADPGDILPGKELEKAVADVATDAGKSLLRGIARTMGAATAEWTAKKEAKADAARKTIETRTAIDRSNALTNARRAAEISEVKHQQQLELAKRRAERMIFEMAREQDNLESITRKSLEFVEQAAPEEKARELDDDWLFKFTRYAETISDKNVQEMWAHILESAAIEGRPKLSAASLFQLSLVEKDAAVGFETFVRVSQSFRLYPAHPNSYRKNVLNIDLMRLEELGLIKAENVTGYQFPDFFLEMADRPIPPVRVSGVASRSIPLFHTKFVFTQIGAEIANAIFSGRKFDDVSLPKDKEQEFLHELISEIASQYALILIRPTAGSYYVILHSDPNSAANVSDELWQIVISEPALPARVRESLIWAKSTFVLTVHALPKA